MSKKGANSGEPITELLTRYQQGDEQAERQLISTVYPELRKIARAQLRNERPDHSLQASALVNEAYIKLVGLTRLDWQSRSHFFGVAARMMRQVLTDHAKARLTEKRGGRIRVQPIEEALLFDAEKTTDILAVDEALESLSRTDPRAAKVVECRFFAGLSIEETAEVVGVGPRTVKRDWQIGRAWLRRRLS